jgi:hypothetical protein
MIRDSSEMIIVIDALDECSEQTRVDELLRFIQNLAGLNALTLRLLVTSRDNHPDIQRCMERLSTHVLVIHTAEEQSLDLARYISYQLDSLPSDWSARTKSVVEEVLKSGADGM